MTSKMVESVLFARVEIISDDLRELVRYINVL